MGQHDVMSVCTGRTLITPIGQLSLGDVLFAAELGALIVCAAFLEVFLITGERKFILQVSVHLWKEGSLFHPASQDFLMEWCDRLRPIVYAKRSCGSIQACLRPAEILRLAQENFDRGA